MHRHLSQVGDGESQAAVISSINFRKHESALSATYLHANIQTYINTYIHIYISMNIFQNTKEDACNVYVCIYLLSAGSSSVPRIIDLKVR